MSVKIIIPGAFTTIQDGGRYGYMASGFTPSGAADLTALKKANLLVGNAPTEAAFEMTLTGMGVQFGKHCFIALTGADMPLHLNGTRVSSYTVHEIHKGDYLYCEAAKSGCRGYLAVSGGVRTPTVLGSRSTSLKLHLGGMEGRALKSGDIIPLGASPDTLPSLLKRHLQAPEYPRDVTLFALRGPQDDRFSEEALSEFFHAAFTVSPLSDRMGLRLSSHPIAAEKGVDIISDGITAGSIQVPKDGNPIVLLSDHQTTGGYAKIATVLSTSLSAASQLTPGCTVRFAEVTPREAEKRYRKEQKYFSELEKQWR